MAVSSSIVTHFTKSLDSLNGIIEEGFKVHYCKETVFYRKPSKSNPPPTMSWAFPMVSFCDIPLSLIVDHTKKYGEYGIGLSKSWAIDKGLNPVNYIVRGSSYARDHIAVLNDQFLKTKDDAYKNGKILNSVQKNALQTLMYCKNYNGVLQRYGEKPQDYNFYDEREWRYCPPASDKYCIGFREYGEEKIDKTKLNETTNHLRLDFKPQDVEYIFISNESEICEVIETIRSSYRKKVDLEAVETLYTKVITIDRIKKDF